MWFTRTLLTRPGAWLLTALCPVTGKRHPHRWKQGRCALTPWKHSVDCDLNLPSCVAVLMVRPGVN